jgi:PhoH-like ATPase
VTACGRQQLKKTFILDTSVLLYDPQSIYKFPDSDIHIPLVVIEELDRFKKDPNENGRNGRAFSRIVDGLRQKGSLSEGVSLENGGKLTISLKTDFDKNSLGPINLTINDNIILAHAYWLKSKGKNVFLISKDINLRVKSDAIGVPSDDYGKMDITIDDLYSGHKILEVKPKSIDEFEENRFLELSKDEMEGISPNEYLTIQEANNPQRRKLGRYCQRKLGIVPLIKAREGLWGIYPKNVEQQFAIDALLNQEVKLVSLVGKAGTGKTLLAIAAGLELTVGKQEYSRLLVSRPVQPMGRDLGFLPGDVNEKLGPWMQPIFDNMDFLFGGDKGHDATSGWDDLINQGLLHIEPLTYIRGRSIPAQYLIVDEAQNLSPHEIKTIITRAGEGTKVILTGDCEQIDNPYLDSVNNGLAYCIERLKAEPIVAHTILKVGERSELSEVASKYL